MILRNFELISGLKVNFHKCSITGLNVEAEAISHYAKKLGCGVAELPINYLGMKVGVNHKSISAWSNLIQKIKKKDCHLGQQVYSIRGRATLVQTVLSAMLIYSLSFFLLPKKICDEILRLQRIFLWGGSEDKSNIPWIKWSEICKNKKEWGASVSGEVDLEIFDKGE
ncbi:hypothetical protein ACS0TY_012005 [Phlomoides rotata]